MNSDDIDPEPKLRRRVKDPWWNGVTAETRIAIYEGAKDAHLLREGLKRSVDTATDQSDTATEPEESVDG